MTVDQLRKYLETLNGDMIVMIHGSDHSYQKALPFSVTMEKVEDRRGTKYVEYYDEYNASGGVVEKHLVFSAR